MFIIYFSPSRKTLGYLHTIFQGETFLEIAQLEDQKGNGKDRVKKRFVLRIAGGWNWLITVFDGGMAVLVSQHHGTGNDPPYSPLSYLIDLVKTLRLT